MANLSGRFSCGELGDCSDILQSYIRSCSALFPLATIFKPKEPPDKSKEACIDSTNDPLASNNVDDELSVATEQRLGL